MSQTAPSDKLLSSFHIHVARALLGWSRGEMAGRAQVARQSVQRLEDGALFSLDSLDAAQAALKAEGVGFTISENGGSVQLVRKPSTDQAPNRLGPQPLRKTR